MDQYLIRQAHKRGIALDFKENSFELNQNNVLLEDKIPVAPDADVFASKDSFPDFPAFSAIP